MVVKTVGTMILIRDVHWILKGEEYVHKQFLNSAFHKIVLFLQ